MLHLKIKKTCFSPRVISNQCDFLEKQKNVLALFYITKVKNCKIISK